MLLVRRVSVRCQILGVVGEVRYPWNCPYTPPPNPQTRPLGPVRSRRRMQGANGTENTDKQRILGIALGVEHWHVCVWSLSCVSYIFFDVFFGQWLLEVGRIKCNMPARCRSSRFTSSAFCPSSSCCECPPAAGGRWRQGGRRNNSGLREKPRTWESPRAPPR